MNNCIVNTIGRSQKLNVGYKRTTWSHDFQSLYKNIFPELFSYNSLQKGNYKLVYLLFG